MKQIFIITICLFITFSMFADASGDVSFKFRDKADYFMKFRGDTYIAFAYYWGKHDGVADSPNIGNIHYSPLDYVGDATHSTDGIGREVGNTWGSVELGLYADYSFEAPFLTTDHFLFSDNNIKFGFHALLSPVHMTFGTSITFQPIAFFVFNAGIEIGSGWSFFGLFHGIGTNIGGEYDTNTRLEAYNGMSFIGPHLQTWVEATFQFDVAALMPKSIKRWTHIVMTATPKFQYEAIVNLSETTPWVWEADDGQNFNGWNFLATFLLGYQISIIEDDTGKDRQFIKMKHNNFKLTVAMLMVIDQLRLTYPHIYDSKMSTTGGWGSDFTRMYFGPLLKFDLPNNLFAVFMMHWRNAPSFTSATVGNADFQNRDYEDWYVYFYRIVFIVRWNF